MRTTIHVSGEQGEVQLDSLSQILESIHGISNIQSACDPGSFHIEFTSHNVLEGARVAIRACGMAITAMAEVEV